MYLKVFFFSALFIFSFAHNVLSESALDVEVIGVEGRLYKNITARLRINLYRQGSVLTESEIRRLHHLAPDDIKSALVPYGYYSVIVQSFLDKSEKGWKARYDVRKGMPVKISKVEVTVTGEGKALKELSKPAGLLGIKSGEILDQPFYEKGKKNLLRTARSLGFLDASFTTHEIRINREKKEAEIELVVNTGQRYHFGKTTSDQDIIDEELLFRFLPYEEGDFFSSGKLYELQRDLYKIDYFGKVVVEGGTSDPDGRYIPISIYLEPFEHYNRYSFGVGYATDTRMHALFEWHNKLFNKSGHRVDASFLVGELDSHCNFGYTIPVADPRFYTIANSVSWNREKWEETKTSLLSAGSAFNYKTPSLHYGISLELRDENYKVGNTSGASLILMPSINGSWALADDLVNTKNGFRASVSVAGASDDIVSDVSFIKVRGDGKVILTPADGWRVIGRGAIGGILVNSIDNIPPSLRFYAGGAKSVRGYQYRTLGSQDDSGTLVGGTLLLTGSIEGERRLSEYFRVFAFYDVGDAMDDFSVDLASGVGSGLSIVLPFGHIRLEFAYPLNNQGDPQYFYLSVGADL